MTLSHPAPKHDFIYALLLLLFLYTPKATHAQENLEPSREDIVREIKIYANRHAKNDTPMQTSLVVDLFRDNKLNITTQEIAHTYEEEYTATKEKNKPSPWEQFYPKAGWAAAALLFILLLFKELLKNTLTQIFKSLGEAIYRRIAGKPLFRRMALKHYRKSLIIKHSKIHIPFRPNRPLDMGEIYVPLKVTGADDATQTEAYHALSKYRRLVLKGAPGAGKSMLLRRIALSYAEGLLDDLWADRPVPVVLELHRLNESKMTLEEQLAVEFSRNDFPQAKLFVSSALEQGALLLLLDGLDEVNSSERKRVVQSIKDFLEQHKKCRTVITCRAATYRGELDDIVEQSLEIIEFDDQQIRKFMGSWEQDLSGRGKSIDQLMQTLYDRPRILALARNPLLLTIIAYLYTDTAFVLPRSRSEFYRKSTDILLDLWHQEHNRFKSSDKRLVLQQLALLNQDATTQQGHDRLSMERPFVLEHLRKMLPNLNIKPENSDLVLDEIVERSGLLLSVDGGERYQFAHLTLQEYFAASEMIDDTEGLLTRFKGSHDDWRETVKLWCGLDHDSTELIRAVNEEESITAFECLAEAQMVQSNLAEDILKSFFTLLGRDTEDAVVRAFGTVAADPRPRGETVFKSLLDLMSPTNELARRIAAANALSLTNLPVAAQALANYYAERAEFRAALIRMGDLAVPALKPLIATRPIEVMNDLLTIGTPNAASVLTPWLWHNEREFSVMAAWRLAALISKPGVEDILREYQLKPSHRKESHLEWVWRPFTEPGNSALPMITGRIAFLLKRADVALAPSTQQILDPRIAIPVCTILRLNEAGLPPVDKTTQPQNFRKPPSILKISQQVWSLDKDTKSIHAEAKASDVAELLSLTNPNSTWRSIFLGLPLKIQYELLSRLLVGHFADEKSSHPVPTEDDWRNIHRPVKFTFARSWHYRFIITVLLVLSGGAVFNACAQILFSPRLFHWENGVIATTAILVVFWCTMIVSNMEESAAQMGPIMIGSIIGPITSIVGFFIDMARRELNAKTLTACAVLSAWMPSLTYFLAAPMLGLYGLAYSVAIWSVLILTTGLLWRIGRGRERKARNLLQEIIVPQALSTPMTRRFVKSGFSWIRFLRGK